MSVQTAAPTQTGACAAAPPVREPYGVDDAVELSRSLKALSDPTRLRLLSLIAAHVDGEACVCDLTGSVDVGQPTISHHLKILREAGLVTSRRRGTWVHYAIVPGAVERITAALAAVTTPLSSGPPE